MKISGFTPSSGASGCTEENAEKRKIEISVSNI